MKLKSLGLLIAIGALVMLSGCSLFSNSNVVFDVADYGYPPFETTLKAVGVTSGTVAWEVEGEIYNGEEVTVTINALPCKVTAVLSNNRTFTKTIALRNSGPILGTPHLQGVLSSGKIVPKNRYIVTFPDAYDKEGGDITMIDASVYTQQWLLGDEWNKKKQYVAGDFAHLDGIVYISMLDSTDSEPPNSDWGLIDQDEHGRYNTVFCPPYAGETPPKPGVYHAQDTTLSEIVDNAFIFFSMWSSDLGPANLPWCPTSRWMRGYNALWTDWTPGSYINSFWPNVIIRDITTIITVTFEDELGATTTESFEIDTQDYEPCYVCSGCSK